MAVDKHEALPIVPLRGMMIFPNMVLHFDIGRPASIAALEMAMASDQRLFLVAQKHEDNENPGPKDLRTVGTVVAIRQVMNLPGENIRVLAEGECRGVLEEVLTEEPAMTGGIRLCKDRTVRSMEGKAMVRTTQDLFENFARISQRVGMDTVEGLKQITKPGELADLLAANILSKLEEKQEILEELDPLRRLEKVCGFLIRENDLLDAEQQIQSRLRSQVEKSQKDYYLREQIRAIQTELGEDETQEENEYRKRMESLPLNEEAKAKCQREIDRMTRIAPGSPEYVISETYVEWILDLPWGKESEDRLDLNSAREILNRDHYGLEKVKERIIEYLAVLRLKKNMKGPILCFVGPPGVGKTSIVQAIAEAVGRKFIRMSLGGVRDEAEIRGHRRTYIGALPGKLVQALKESKAMNPVILLDEIDKLKESYHGDPAGALLETLDPEQNSGFRDHYLDVKIDLSKCLFICTANSLDTIPPALLDRMDAIRLSGYLAEEKFLIAKKHLIPKALEKAGIKNKEIRFQDGALRKIIDEYARESGVRNLEKCIGRIIRKGVIKLVEKETEKITVKPADIRGYLGVPPFARERTLEGIGIVTGLAWTSVGGATLPVEAKLVDRYAKNFSLTGNLGNVMKESASIALSYISSNAASFGADIPDNFFEKANIHLHVPEGATPKDGPSAGITMASAILSLVLNRAPKANYAMTGELSLTGNVLAIGGIREKVIAAKRVGITNLIVPAANREDVAELPDYVREGVNFNFVDKYEEVARILFDIGK